MEKSLESYDKMHVRRAVMKNVLPAVAAMLMTLIYNLADTYFIGKTNDAYQVAAVSLATPVFLIFMAVGTIFGAGGTSVISRDFGEGKGDHAGKIGSFCLWSCLGLGTTITVGMLLFMDPLLAVIGASEKNWDLTKEYLVIVSFSGPFALTSSCFSNVQRAKGQASRAMTGQIIGNLTITGAVLTAVCYALDDRIVSAFLSDRSAFDYALEFTKILLSTGPLFGIFYVITNALQAMGAAKASLIANISRQGLVYIPMLFVLGSLFGVDGLVWSQPVADVISFVTALCMYAMVSRKKEISLQLLSRE